MSEPKTKTLTKQAAEFEACPFEALVMWYFFANFFCIIDQELIGQNNNFHYAE